MTQIFPGTNRERDALLAAINRDCSCKVGSANGPAAICTAHALLRDEAALKRLIFYHRWAVALQRGEWLEDPHWTGEGLSQIAR